MKDIPIIFSGPMVRALLEGRKMMTRRLAWVSPGKSGRRAKADRDWPPGMWPSSWQNRVPGDRLWVRESLAQHGHFGFPLGAVPQVDDHQGRIWSYMADALPNRTGGRPSIHMPRWASRLTLIVTTTKIEQIRDISEADSIAEGIARNPVQNDTNWIAYPEGSSASGYARAWDSFRSLWVDLHGAASWVDNVEVVALTFTVHKQNIDAMPKADAA